MVFPSLPSRSDQRGHLNRMLRFWAQLERATAFSLSLGRTDKIAHTLSVKMLPNVWMSDDGLQVAVQKAITLNMRPTAQSFLLPFPIACGEPTAADRGRRAGRSRLPASMLRSTWRIYGSR